MKRITAGLSAAAVLALGIAGPAAAATPKNTAGAPLCSTSNGVMTISENGKDLSSYWLDGNRGEAVEIAEETTSISPTGSFSSITVKLAMSKHTFTPNSESCPSVP